MDQTGTRTLTTRVNISDFIGGAALVALGAFVVAVASTYPIGHLTRMGPGFFPIVLGALLILLGVGIVLQGRRKPDGFPHLKLRAVFSISAAIIAFGFCAAHLGIVPATFAVVLISSLADPSFRPVTAFLTAVILAAFAYLVFIEALGVTMHAFWW